jgi:hypothetical protein
LPLPLPTRHDGHRSLAIVAMTSPPLSATRGLYNFLASLSTCSLNHTFAGSFSTAACQYM